MTKAYITSPVSYTQNRLDLLPHIKEVVEANGIEPFVFEIGGEANDIFSRDYTNLASSNIIIAEVSERSHGVGIELGLSYGLGLKRILLLAEGSTVSKLAEGMTDTTILVYKNVKHLKQILSLELASY
ncbi:MAG TPA: hypothetical protein VIM31_01660 [Candidatus Microsaccharimonas sp.]|jgi:hypothetical protein